MARDDDHRGLLGHLAGAVHVRAASRDKTAALRKWAETEPVGSPRNGLLDLSRRFDGMADSIDRNRQR